MNKDLLKQYIDAKELIKETEADIRRLENRKKQKTQDIVSGSNSEFPFQAKHFVIQGTQYSTRDAAAEAKERIILQERKEKAEALRLQVEAWMNTIPFRMQRIIKYKEFEGMSWQQVAAKLGRNASGESVRKEYELFLKK